MSDAEGTLQNKIATPKKEQEINDSADREDIEDEDDATSANTDVGA
jgi:hypothetical protein